MTSKQLCIAATLYSAVAANVAADERSSNNEKNDTANVHHLQAIEVVAGRAKQAMPITLTNLTRQQLERKNHGRDLPQMLEFLPGATVTSDSGMGIGYTSLRIRGIDPSRINVTLNGIPMNDAESHQQFWVNTGDIVSSIGSIQVQRGAGTSTNGAGAFGASVNMQSAPSATKPYMQFDGSYGMWHTHKETFRMGTGMMHDHWTFDARLSNIASDGYIDRASTHLQSFFTQTGFFATHSSVKLLLFGSKEKTYHAWNYLYRELWDGGYDEEVLYGRRYNSCGEYYDANGEVHYYDGQTDNYAQLHSQLLINHKINDHWHLNTTIHYTKGDGYYEEYKTNRLLMEYALATDNAKSDIVRRKCMDNYFMGEMLNVEYSNRHWNIQFGEATNYYNGNHYGRVLWVQQPVAAYLSPNHQYYFNKAQKTDMNCYTKGTYSFARSWNAYVDLQYRYVNYQINGTNDNWDGKHNHMQPLAISDNFHFFNTRLGLNWLINKRNRLFANWAHVSKEPYRNCYTDAHIDKDGNIRSYPKAESMHDTEFGYELKMKRLTIDANVYHMHYTNQLVLTGEINEIGEALTSNINKSYRMGVELQCSYHPVTWFHWEANGTWSHNRICNFKEYLTDYDTGNEVVLSRGNTPISFSPQWVAANRFTFNIHGIEVAIQTKFVSKQYMSNANMELHTLDKYTVTDILLGYTFTPKRHIKTVGLGMDINNIFNEQYETNGYAGSYFSGGLRYNYIGYSVQAGINILGHITIKF